MVFPKGGVVWSEKLEGEPKHEFVKVKKVFGAIPVIVTLTVSEKLHPKELDTSNQ